MPQNDAGTLRGVLRWRPDALDRGAKSGVRLEDGVPPPLAEGVHALLERRHLAFGPAAGRRARAACRGSGAQRTGRRASPPWTSAPGTRAGVLRTPRHRALRASVSLHVVGKGI